MKLYNYWRSSSSYRVRIALAFKGLDYEYVPVNLLGSEQHGEAHRERSPWGSVPVLEVEDEGHTLRLPQSVAILEYLEERWPTPPLLPASRADRARVRSLVELVNSSIQPFHNLSTLKQLEAMGADSKAWAAHFIGTGLRALEAQASRSAGRFLVGDTFTLADACLVPQLFGARRFATVDPAQLPVLHRVEAACLALDFVQRARPEVQPDAKP